MKSTYAGNSQFPQNQLVATTEEKQEILGQFGKEIEIDEGIVEVLSSVNSASLFLTESSCQGSDGDPTSNHFDRAYIAIGALYNQHQLLEQFVKLIKRHFRDNISISLNSHAQCVWKNPENGNVVPIFRTFLRVNFIDKSVFPEFQKAVEKFKQIMPSQDRLKDVFDKSLETELNISEAWNQFISQSSIELVSNSVTVEKQEILRTLTSHQFSEIKVADEEARSGYPPAIHISFSYSKEKNVEHLFRPLAYIFGTDIKLYNPIEMDKHKNFTKVINIYLFEMPRIYLLHSILKRWCESSNGMLI